MSKFKKKKDGGLPPVNTAALPDIVFMLLFFFMTVTVMKDNTLKIKQQLPSADQLHTLDKKDPVIYIYAGEPLDQFKAKWGSSAKIQLNDSFKEVTDIAQYILSERADFRQDQQNKITTALKVDGETNMGLISDIKQELRDVNALKINYIANKKSE